MVFITFVINLCVINRMMLYQIIPVHTILIQPFALTLLWSIFEGIPMLHMTIFTIKNRFKMNFVKELKYKFEEKRRCIVIYTVNHVDSIWTERFNSASILELTEECLQTTTIEHPYSVFSTTNHKSLVYKTPTTVPCSSRFKVTSISNSEYVNQPDSIQYGYLIKLQSSKKKNLVIRNYFNLYNALKQYTYLRNYVLNCVS